jgi:hypothetical protein
VIAAPIVLALALMVPVPDCGPGEEAWPTETGYVCGPADLADPTLPADQQPPPLSVAPVDPPSDPGVPVAPVVDELLKVGLAVVWKQMGS